MIAFDPSALTLARPAAPLQSARPPTVASSAGADVASFGQLLDQLAADAVNTVKVAETTAIASIEGKASIQQVVDSVMSAERTLQTMVALRDKTVQAYHDIASMTI